MRVKTFTKRLGPAYACAYATNLLVVLTVLCQKCSGQRIDVPAEVIGESNGTIFMCSI